MKTVNIAIIGKTGNGKSSTGNTILQTMAFEEVYSSTAGTTITELRKGFIKDDETTTVKWRLYETPGLMSFRFDTFYRKRKNRDEMDRLIRAAGEIHVFILVFSINCRYTEEEKETVKELKEIFGKDFIKDHGMIVVTHGDDLERKAQELDTPCEKMFHGWCEGFQLNDLLSSNEENILLINNQGDFSPSSKRLKSSKDLRNMVQHIIKTKKVFTKEEYFRRTRLCAIL